eukprot:488036-Prorocentrum_lima.AAC.1
MKTCQALRRRGPGCPVWREPKCCGSWAFAARRARSKLRTFYAANEASETVFDTGIWARKSAANCRFASARQSSMEWRLS